MLFKEIIKREKRIDAVNAIFWKLLLKYYPTFSYYGKLISVATIFPLLIYKFGEPNY